MNDVKYIFRFSQKHLSLKAAAVSPVEASRNCLAVEELGEC